MPKPNKNIMRKENYRPIPLMKNPSKHIRKGYPAIYWKNKIKYHDQAGFIPGISIKESDYVNRIK